MDNTKFFDKGINRVLRHAYLNYRAEAIRLTKGKNECLNDAETMNIVYLVMEKHLSEILAKVVSKIELDMGPLSFSQKEDFKKKITEFLSEVEKEIRGREKRGEKIKGNSQIQRIWFKLSIWKNKIFFSIISPLMKHVSNKHPHHS